MLQDVTLETFAPHVGETFACTLEGGPTLELRLAEATAAGAPQPGRQPFSLIFHGPLQPVMPQATRALRHPELAQLDIFLVPIGPEGRAMRYQAVFA